MARLDKQDTFIAAQGVKITELDDMIDMQRAKITELETSRTDHGALIQRLMAQIAEQDGKIAEQDGKITEVALSCRCGGWHLRLYASGLSVFVIVCVKVSVCVSVSICVSLY